MTGEPKTYMKEMPVIVEPTERWVRAGFAGVTIADSKNTMLLIEYGQGVLPRYFFPREDIRVDLLRPSERSDHHDGTTYWDVVVGDHIAKRAAWSYTDPPADRLELRNLISLTWFQMDHWYEEEEEVFVHPRDPYKRVDVMPSSRLIRVEIDGVTVAETNRPHLLFETHLPVRYYIPPDDINLELLKPSATQTQCPYKGVASYWSTTINGTKYPDIVWCYPDPIPENPKIRGLMCFYNERTDIWLDGELQARPITPFSQGSPRPQTVKH